MLFIPSVQINITVEVPDSPSLNFGAGNFSISVWVRLYHRYQLRSLVDKRGVNYVGYCLVLDYGWVTFQMGDASGYTNYTYSTEYLDNSGWRNVVITVARGIFNRVRIYIDGEKVAEFNDPRLGSVTNDRPLLIAESYGAWNYVGDLDEVMLYNQELSSNEVREIHMNGQWTDNTDGNDYYRQDRFQPHPDVH